MKKLIKIFKKIKSKAKDLLKNKKKYPPVTYDDWEDFWYNSK